jgi:undecaprenyl-diphosphatase
MSPDRRGSRRAAPSASIAHARARLQARRPTLHCATAAAYRRLLDLFQVIALALMQGLTEFLPISTSAHLVLPSMLLGWPQQGLALDVALHAGSLAAVIAFFRKDLVHFGAGIWRWIREGQADVYVRLMAQVVTATIPIVVLGVLLRDWIEPRPRSLALIAATAIGFALLMWVADTRVERSGTTEFELSWRDALLIGLLQMLAIVPGASRSGITMTAGLLLGMSREAASRFAFLLAIPTILGTTTLGTIGAMQAHVPVEWADSIVAFSVSAIASFASIHYFLKWIERTGVAPYVAYLLAFGVLLLGIGLVRG